MKKFKESKSTSNRKILKWIIIVFTFAPLLINVGLVITDTIYEHTGFTLTAYGLNNVYWLDFWKQYLAVSISFLGIYLVYLSSSEDREKQLYEKNAEQYLEEVRREEIILVEVAQSFNTGIVYDALLQQAKSNIYDGRKVLSDSRAQMSQSHIKFEILTNLCDDFKKCETCSFSPCVDKSIMVQLRDLFYDIEKHYFDMLESSEIFLERLAQEQRRMNSLNIENSLYSNTNSLTNLYRDRGLYKQEHESKRELEHIRERIQRLEKSKLEAEELNKFVEMIQKEKNYIDKEMRPKFIRYCKAYIDIKKAHAMDLRTVGYIIYKKTS